MYEPLRGTGGLLRVDGSLVWWDAVDRSSTCLHAFGDFTGRGRMEAVGIGYDDGSRCYDAATGRILWHLADGPAKAPVETASADVNGDGRDEALITQGSTLFCLGVAQAPSSAEGAVQWKLELPISVGPPVIADPGDGLSILLAGSDGCVYCVR